MHGLASRFVDFTFVVTRFSSRGALHGVLSCHFHDFLRTFLYCTRPKVIRSLAMLDRRSRTAASSSKQASQQKKE
jgi:hypothetical protein